MKFTFAVCTAFVCYLAVDAFGRNRHSEKPLPELVADFKRVCERNNSELWEKVIRCHDPMTDESLRESIEASCPLSERDPDPTDPDVSMRRVFEIICNSVDDKAPNHSKKARDCILKGHEEEVIKTQDEFGDSLPDDITDCIADLDFESFPKNA